MAGGLHTLFCAKSLLPGRAHDDLILQASLDIHVPSPERNAWDDDQIVFSVLLCSGIGLARVIQVDKMNISCCCLGKCLSGPGEKRWSPSRADGMGQTSPPAPLVRRPSLREAPGHLSPGWLSIRLFQLAGERSLCLAVPFRVHAGKEIYGGNLGEGIVYLLNENFGKPLLGTQTSQGSN